MAIQALVTAVTPVFDDGNAFLFQFQDFNNNTLTSGFIHRPFRPPRPRWPTLP